jgi:hypothetical protein
MSDIRVPTPGGLVAKSAIVRWRKQPGDPVEIDEPLVELETDELIIVVKAPAAGALTTIAAKDGEIVVAGTPLGYIDGNEGYSSIFVPSLSRVGVTSVTPMEITTEGQLVIGAVGGAICGVLVYLAELSDQGKGILSEGINGWPAVGISVSAIAGSLIGLFAVGVWRWRRSEKVSSWMDAKLSPLPALESGVEAAERVGFGIFLLSCMFAVSEVYLLPWSRWSIGTPLLNFVLWGSAAGGAVGLFKARYYRILIVAFALGAALPWWFLRPGTPPGIAWWVDAPLNFAIRSILCFAVIWPPTLFIAWFFGWLLREPALPPPRKTGDANFATDDELRHKGLIDER